MSASVKILRYHPELSDLDFRDIDYIRSLPIRLAPKNTFDKGVLIQRDFYESSSLSMTTGEEEFSNHLIRETYDYVRDPDGFALSRDMTIQWVTEDEDFHDDVKVRTKTYDLTERIRETDRRRRNIIDHIKTKTLGILVAYIGYSQAEAVQQGQSLFGMHQLAISKFLDIGDNADLVSDLQSDTTHSWLDAQLSPTVTIRLMIIGDLL